VSELALCPHHHIVYDDWARQNRVACAFFHRKKLQQSRPMTAEEFVEWTTRVNG
jgi:hypothetical protein